jgi:outer membrane receptor protein involved in Fe transport
MGDTGFMKSIKRDFQSGSTSQSLRGRTDCPMRHGYIGKSLALGGLVAWTCLPGFVLAAAATSDVNDSSGLAEITVTAEKYNSTIQNTPISMSALTGEQLNAAGITTMEDVVHDVPGLSMRTSGPGLTEFEARGLASNGGASPTVGFYLDEVPLSPPALSQAGKVVIDPDLYDVNRIEVLRGPQGTLYGSGSMGGTVKIVTNQPKLNTWEGSVQGTVSDTQGGSGNGGGSFMINAPIGDVLAVRVVASDTYRSGWIDRVVVSPFPEDLPTAPGLPPPVLRTPNILSAPVQNVVTNVNTENLYGARASILFQPTADFSVTATAFYQRLVMGGYDTFDSPPGPSYAAHYEAFDIPEPVSDTVHIYSITAVANLGFADLTSATAYWQRYEHQTQDASESASYANGIYPYVSLPFSENDPSQQFNQEIRLSSREDDRLHWVTGAYFSDLHSLWQEWGTNPIFVAPGNSLGLVYAANNPYHMDQYALFADGSFKITDTLKLSAGLRWYRYQSEQDQQEWGADGPFGITPPPRSQTTADNSGYNPRINLSYSPTTDLTTYVEIAKGFRPGGANMILPPANTPPLYCATTAPPSFGSDHVWNYEIGEKAKFLNNWLSVNSDFYYIQWNDIQQTLLISCGYQYQANAGNGRSFGPEFEVNAKLSPEWMVSGSYTYTDARVTSPNATFLNFLTNIATTPSGTPYCATAAGCTAPIMNVPKETATLALVYNTKVMQNYELTARVADNYVGSAFDEAYYYGIRLPSYSIANARIGLSNDRWSASLFVNNFTNKVAEMTANTTSFQFNIPALTRYATNQPRTFGTQINYKF